ncbi:OmpA family protein [Vibrio vulnificus]|nr:OmpA family protein [Vibrio vulnificus]
MKKLTLLAIICAAPALASAKYPQPFIGAKGGYQWAIDNNYNHSEPESAILGIYSGLQFSPSWSWDAGYQYHNELKADVTSVNVKTWLIESALRYDWYLQDNLSIFGRLGAAYWDMEKTQLSSNKSDAAGFSPIGEVGINYHFNPNVRLSTSYQHIDSIGKSNTGKYDSHGVLASLTYTFGVATQPALVETISMPSIEEVPIKKVVTVKANHPIQIFSPKVTNVFFGFDSIEFNYDFVEQLAEIAFLLNTYPQAKAVVVGHTDSIGAVSYNQKLSERRAQVVVNKLIELKVAPTQLEWKGEGESSPIVNNTTAEERAKNRRVKITIPRFQFEEQAE